MLNGFCGLTRCLFSRYAPWMTGRISGIVTAGTLAYERAK